ncbi:MAG: orotate phosphoribosyltransferase [Bacteriovoracaceae bacterium]|jgi:orotate phosphoribosyltransferase
MFETDRGLKFAKLLLSLGCVQVSPDSPYTYASGLMGPIYTDNRQILSYVPERLEVAEGLVDLIRESKLKFDSIAGLATAGIPHGMLTSHMMGSPFIYIRGKAKGHGKGNLIEGRFKKGDRIILVEDLVNQGSSLDSAVMGAKEAGLVPVACVCIVDYQMPAAVKVLEKHDLPLFSLTNFSQISHAAASENNLSPDSVKLLDQWHKDPANWP